MGLREVDRNVVPFHPKVLLMWGAHMNIQRITNSAWSFYLCTEAGAIVRCARVQLFYSLLSRYCSATVLHKHTIASPPRLMVQLKHPSISSRISF